MMSLSQAKIKIQVLDQKIEKLFVSLQSSFNFSTLPINDWRQKIIQIENELNDDVIKVAVIGAIKSGKSTLVNAILGGDFLKRGAGVITSIVTRIRKGDISKATLKFKSIEEINADIQNGLALFPSLSIAFNPKQFDVLNDELRHATLDIVSKFYHSQPSENNKKNSTLTLIHSYLTGFPQIQDIFIQKKNPLFLTDQDFKTHQLYSGNEINAVFLKDILLQIVSKNLVNGFEIADCQGSDSLNPLHLAMIQDYLLETHYIIYVVSSRTGLRQADLSFLNMIKNMGLQDNLIFVLNCDLSEHETLLDLKRLFEKFRLESQVFREDAEIFTFSALHHLFSTQAVNLAKKDVARLAMWDAEKEFIQYSRSEKRRFDEYFHKQIIGNKSLLLLRHQFDRQEKIITAILNWTKLHKNIIQQNGVHSKKFIEKIEAHRKQMRQMMTTAKRTLDGTEKQIVSGLRAEVDRFFDPHMGTVHKKVIHFINSYSFPEELITKHLGSSDFSKTLFMVFLNFKENLDRYLTENINPEIFNFIQNLEKEVQHTLIELVSPLELMVSKVMDDIKLSLEDDVELTPLISQLEIKNVSLETIKRNNGLHLPSATSHLNYNVKLKAEAYVQRSIFQFRSIFKKIFKKGPQKEYFEDIQAIKKGLQRIQAETIKSLDFHFKDYKENIKFQYLFKLVKVLKEALFLLLEEAGALYAEDVLKLQRAIDMKHVNIDDINDLLLQMNITCEQIKKEIHENLHGLNNY